MSIREKIDRIVEHPAAPYIVISVILFFILIPIVWTFLTSFKPLSETYISPPTIFPHHFTLDTYISAFSKWPIPTYITNSFIIAGSTAAVSTVAGVFTAYGLSQYKYKHSEKMISLFAFSRIIPPIGLLVAFFLLYTKLGLIDTIPSVVIYTTYLSYPLVTIIMEAFFEQFPRELLESALLDGCSRTRAIFEIVLPTSATGIATAAIISFMWAWNEFLGPLLFIHSEELKPITVGIYYFVGDEFIHWNGITASGILAVIPTLVLFVLLQRYIVKGMTAGALKF